LQLFDLTGLATDSLLPLLLALESASALTALSVASVRIPDDFLPTLVPCTALQTLDLSQNPDVTAAGLQATLPALQQLQQLNLAGTAVDDAVLLVLAHLPKLQELMMSGTAVTWEWDAASTVLQQEPEQEQGSGSSRSSSDRGSSSAGRQLWQQLQVLDLCDTHITDAGCQQLARQLAAVSTAPSPSPAAAADGISEGGDDVCTSGGLRTLLVGSSSGSRAKLGKLGLAALARIGSLQQLTLQVRRLWWCERKLFSLTIAAA
jgi:hypothetical protein